jgi:hypothetical protein
MNLGGYNSLILVAILTAPAFIYLFWYLIRRKAIQAELIVDNDIHHQPALTKLDEMLKSSKVAPDVLESISEIKKTNQGLREEMKLLTATLAANKLTYGNLETKVDDIIRMLNESKPQKESKTAQEDQEQFQTGAINAFLERERSQTFDYELNEKVLNMHRVDRVIKSMKLTATEEQKQNIVDSISKLNLSPTIENIKLLVNLSDSITPQSNQNLEN